MNAQSPNSSRTTLSGIFLPKFVQPPQPFSESQSLHWAGQLTSDKRNKIHEILNVNKTHNFINNLITQAANNN
jgi:hypothetical protein